MATEGSDIHSMIIDTQHTQPEEDEEEDEEAAAERKRKEKERLA